MPAILHTLPARYPQTQFALPLPRRTWYLVEVRRQWAPMLAMREDGTLMPELAWFLTARYGRRNHARAHAQLIAREYGGRYEVRIRKEVSP